MKNLQTQARKIKHRISNLGIIIFLNSVHLYIQNDTSTIRTYCNSIIEFYKKKVQKKNFENKNYFISKRWIYLLEVIKRRGYKSKFEFIVDEDNILANIFFRQIT